MEMVDRRSLILGAAGVLALAGCSGHQTDVQQPKYDPADSEERQKEQDWGALVARSSTQLNEHLRALGIEQTFPLLRFNALTEDERQALNTSLSTDGFFHIDGDDLTIAALLSQNNEPFNLNRLVLATVSLEDQARFIRNPKITNVPHVKFTLDYAKFLRYDGGHQVEITNLSNSLPDYINTPGAIKYLDIAGAPSLLAPLFK